MTAPCLAHPDTRCASCPDCEVIVAKAERSFGVATPIRHETRWLHLAAIYAARQRAGLPVNLGARPHA